MQVFRKNLLVGCYNTQYFQLQLKDALTPYLPTMVERKLWLPTWICFLPLHLPTTLRWLCISLFSAHFMICNLCAQRHLFESLKTCLYTFKNASLSNNHNSSSWHFTNRTNLESPCLFKLASFNSLIMKYFDFTVPT